MYPSWVNINRMISVKHWSNTLNWVSIMTALIRRNMMIVFCICFSHKMAVICMLLLVLWKRGDTAEAQLGFRCDSGDGWRMALSPECELLVGWCTWPVSPSCWHPGTASAGRLSPEPAAASPWRRCGCGAASAGFHSEPPGWALTGQSGEEQYHNENS